MPLFLRRKLDEEIVINLDGKELRFFIADIRGKYVDIGFDEFKDYTVRRGELDERIKSGIPAPIKGLFSKKLKLKRVNCLN